MGGVILASSDPMNHVYQWVYQSIHVTEADTVLTPGGSVTLVSNHVIMQLIAVLLLVLLIPRCVRMPRTSDSIHNLTPHAVRNFFESICAYFRDTVARPILGDRTDAFIPYVWTAFFYVLFINLLGLLPLEPLTRGLVQGIWPDAHHGIGGSATGSLWSPGRWRAARC